MNFSKKNQGVSLYLRSRQAESAGVTLIELVIVVAVFLLLSSFLSLNLFKLPSKTNITSITSTVITDLKSQQIKAMVGDTEGRAIPDDYGIYFSTDKYVQFHGQSYSPTDPDNFESVLPSGYTISATVPSSMIIFKKGSGEVINFSPTQNSITVSNPQSALQKTFYLNKYGTITAVN